jgi:hypothetical protein
MSSQNQRCKINLFEYKKAVLFGTAFFVVGYSDYNPNPPSPLYNFSGDFNFIL